MANPLSKQAQQTTTCSNSGSAGTGCKFCDKKGLLIWPLRYAAIGKLGKDGLKALPKLAGTLGQGLTAQTLTHSQYAVRALRKGYLYVLVERATGGKRWQSYFVTHDGYLSEFPYGSPPIVEPTFTCCPDICGLNASMVAIDQASDVTNAYLLFTPNALTTAILDDYSANAKTYASAGKMQHFQPSAWLTGTTNQAHSLMANNVNSFMAEMIAEQQHPTPEGQVLSKALGRTLHPPLSAGGDNELAWLQKSGYIALDLNGLLNPTIPLPPQTHYGKLQTYLTKQQKQGAAFVLHDPIGITQELNNYRNASYDRIDEFMAQGNKGVTNLRKFNVAQALEDVQFGLENAIIGKAETRIDIINSPLTDYSDIQYPAGIVTPSERAQYLQKVIDFRNKEYKPAAERATAKIRAEAAEKAKKSFNKYADLLNIKERDDFLNSVSVLTQACKDEAEKRAPDHIKWLAAPLFLAALEAYDKKHIGAGLAFEYQATLCTLGIEGCTAYFDLLHRWASSTTIKPDNLLYRTHIRNQEELKTEAEKALAEAKVLAATGPIWPAAQKAFKSMNDLFKKSDGLIEEYLKKPTVLPDFGQKNMEVAALRLSQWGQVLYKYGIGNKADQALTAMLGGFLYSGTGNLASSIRLDELQKAFDEKGVKLSTTAAASIAEVQQDAVRESIDKALKQGPSGKFYQVRVGVIVGLLESWNLYNKASKLDGKWRAYTEASAAGLALTAASLEIAYSGAKLINANASTAAAIKAGDVVRGGLKFTGAFFGAVAGCIGGFLDFTDAWKLTTGSKNNYLLGTAYAIRGLVQLRAAYLSLVVGFTYTSSVLERMGYKALSERAALMAAPKIRAIWLLRVCKFTWIGIAITVGIEILLSYLPDKLEDWCKESTYRKDKTEKPFNSEADEIDHLYRAFAGVV